VVKKCGRNKPAVRSMFSNVSDVCNEKHDVIRRYNVWKESFVSENCTYNVVSI
jgi:hypothetical protein